MANSPSHPTKWSPQSSSKAASGFGLTQIPLAREARVTITSIEKQPSVNVLVPPEGTVRPEFVDSVVRRLFGLQADDSKHTWTIVEEPRAAPTIIPVTDNPRVNSFLEEKINGAEIGA
jgi:hypothetical protein